MANANMGASQALLEAMAQCTGTKADDWFAVFKARQGMQVVLESVAGDVVRNEVVTQLFTCVTAIDPILEAGLVPCYADVSSATLAADLATVEVGAHTCAVVLQNTFGIIDAASARTLCDAAHAAGAVVAEDSAHCVGRMARDEHGNPLADVSVHSFGVEKILPGVYFGGAVWVNPAMPDQEARSRMRSALGALVPVRGRVEKATRAYRNQMRVLTRLPHGAATVLRSKWERAGRLEPAVAEVERRGHVSHEPAAPSPWVAEQALAALQGLDANEQNRRACVSAYLQAFDDDALRALCVPQALLENPDQPLLRFPVFLGDPARADDAIAAIARLGFYAQAWPRPLLLPGVLDPAPYGIAQGTGAWPVSERLSEGVVALPCDMDPDHVPAVAGEVLSRYV